MNIENKSTLTNELRQAVAAIKTAILESQGRALRMVNGMQLSLYFGVGLYVSANTRKGTWGTGAVDKISEQLRRELPGLRGFSAQNIWNMRQFAEFWQNYIFCSPLASKTESANLQDEIEFDRFALSKWSPMARKWKFKPAYFGQLYAYLQVLDDKVRKPHENPSIGIVLCKFANQSYAEYAVRDYNKPMGVATYKTFSDMPREMQQALPDVETLVKLMDDDI